MFVEPLLSSFSLGEFFLSRSGSFFYYFFSRSGSFFNRSSSYRSSSSGNYRSFRLYDVGYRTFFFSLDCGNSLFLFNSFNSSSFTLSLLQVSNESCIFLSFYFCSSLGSSSGLAVFCVGQGSGINNSQSWAYAGSNSLLVDFVSLFLALFGDFLVQFLLILLQLFLFSSKSSLLILCIGKGSSLGIIGSFKYFLGNYCSTVCQVRQNFCGGLYGYGSANAYTGESSECYNSFGYDTHFIFPSHCGRPHNT